MRAEHDPAGIHKPKICIAEVELGVAIASSLEGAIYYWLLSAHNSGENIGCRGTIIMKLRQRLISNAKWLKTMKQIGASSGASRDGCRSARTICYLSLKILARISRQSDVVINLSSANRTKRK